MYTNEYIEFLIQFHGKRDYFECHEILEDYWKSVDPKNKQSIWVGLILLAVSNYHHRRGNFSGSERTLAKSISILQKNYKQLSELGLDAESLMNDLHIRQEKISSGEYYISYHMPIQDEALLATCIKQCVERGIKWGVESNLKDLELIHRHSLRDRSMVIQTRLEALNNGTE
ncbi:putative metal-dependent hydrolase [Cytobacillus eiseniae]|uniref:Metal-dependent hydrolase n=1 Tax=Cytobacillus eiseniae TaxID=762947 RepID=A0ABS4REG1_9BACI|nr:putative metal-dependent hydrolase [Cytobacillus eiseniae]